MDTARRVSPLEALAKAYGRAVPEHPADDGLFGPRSVVWRINRDRVFPLAGMRSLMLQALHPLAMAGVAQHSTWKDDPFGRLAATSSYLVTTTYGDTESALAAAAWVRKVHTRVRGTDPATGLPYSAEDPDLLLWVHAGMVESIVTVVQRYGRPLEPADADRYVAEMVRFAEIVGVPARTSRPPSTRFAGTSSPSSCGRPRRRRRRRSPSSLTRPTWTTTCATCGGTSARLRSARSRIGRARCTASRLRRQR